MQVRGQPPDELSGGDDGARRNAGEGASRRGGEVSGDGGEQGDGKVRLMVEIDPNSKPISGTVAGPDHAAPREFFGWLELTEALEAARISQNPVAPSADGGAA